MIQLNTIKMNNMVMLTIREYQQKHTHEQIKQLQKMVQQLNKNHNISTITKNKTLNTFQTMLKNRFKKETVNNILQLLHMT